MPIVQGPPPTRALAPPPTTSLTPPEIIKPQGWEPPEEPQLPYGAGIDLPPMQEAGTPIGQGESGEATEEETEGEKDPEREVKDTVAPPPPEIPMAPFDASTIIEVTIPIIEQEVEIPVPKAEVVITAGTTAAVATVGATGAAVFAKPLFDQLIRILKPLLKQVLKKLMGKKEKVYPPSVPLELPSQLRFGSSHQEPLRLHRGTPKHKGKKDDNKSRS